VAILGVPDAPRAPLFSEFPTGRYGRPPASAILDEPVPEGSADEDSAPRGGSPGSRKAETCDTSEAAPRARESASITSRNASEEPCWRVSSGTTSDVEMQFPRAGDYPPLCRIADRERGDPPHSTLGMVKAFSVR
jgi:hypothetical protein